MSVEKKSLINNMTATRKALFASSTASPIVSNKIAEKGSVSASKVAASKVAASKVAASKFIASKLASKTASKLASKTASKLASKTASKMLR